MATVTAGTLITTDPPARVILKHLNESLPSVDQFIIKELDNTHLVIKTEQFPFVQDLLRQHLEQNTYTKSELDPLPALAARKAAKAARSKAAESKGKGKAPTRGGGGDDEEFGGGEVDYDMQD